MRPIAGLVDFEVQGCTFFIYIYLDRVPMNKIFFLDSFSYSGKYGEVYIHVFEGSERSNSGSTQQALLFSMIPLYQSRVTLTRLPATNRQLSLV